MNRDQQEIRLEVLLTLSDFLRANYWFLFKKYKMLLFLILVAGAVTPLFIWLGMIPRQPDENFWWLLIPWGILLLLISSTYFSAKRQLASHKSSNETNKYVFSANGIYSESASSSGFQKWDNINEAYETKSNILLFLSLNSLFVIPKRCFQNEAQFTDFKELLTNELGEKFKS